MNTLYFIRKDTTHSKGFVRPSRHYWLLITKRGCDSQVVAYYNDLLVKKNEWLRTMSWKKKGTNELYTSTIYLYFSTHILIYIQLIFFCIYQSQTPDCV